jgi:hypothetical protein
VNQSYPEGKENQENGRNFKQKANFSEVHTVKINDCGQTSLKLLFILKY